ncbi:MAG: type II secretion system protein [Candidatus Riflebacteria bacterium]|nr:type II secretion system protein [Candidatus Riflebacteria bacterium]
MRNKRGFTLIEIVVACGIMGLFMYGVYTLYTGGSKTAAKGQYINDAVNELRNATSLLHRTINSATYPTTMFSDKFYDPCDNTDKSVAAQFYLKILKDAEKIKVPASGQQTIMKWVVSSPEKPPESTGKITKHELILAYEAKYSAEPLGKLILKTEAFTFTTDAHNNYARSGKLNLAPIPNESSSKTLVNNVNFVEFMVGGTIPPEKPVDFLPISVKISTVYPKDEKVVKENSIMATPQVGIDLL